MAYKDKEKEKAYQAAYMPAYQAKNAEKLKIYHAAYQAKNAEKIKAQKAAYRTKNIDQEKAYHRAYRAEHAEKIHAWKEAHRKARPDLIQARNQRRRARKRNAPINDFTAGQWRAMQSAFDHRCSYCHKRCKGKLTQDHIQPLSKGGSHTLSNIIPACRSCNSKKHDGPVLSPIQPLLIA